MWGKTEQVSTTGAQLFNKAAVTQRAYISDYDGSLKGPYSPEHEMASSAASDYVLIPDGTKYIFITKVSEKAWGAFYDAEKQFVSGITGYSGGSISVNVPENAKYARFTVANKNIDDFMVVAGENAKPYEPYSGGLPSPSTGWKQPIETTDTPVTITFSGGAESQSITLVPPRPLTKWDKLEKVDGVWRWMYQSRWIESYVDENITGEYISTTGGLDAGAKVCYKSTPEYIPLPQPVQDRLNALTMYAGTTEITNDGGCNMELTYTVDTKTYVDTKIAEVSKAII